MLSIFYHHNLDKDEFTIKTIEIFCPASEQESVIFCEMGGAHLIQAGAWQCPAA